MKLLITGGTGFIGKKLVLDLVDQNHDVTILSRNPNKTPDDFKSEAVNSNIKMVSDLSAIEDSDYFDYIINLAGAPIDKKWSDGYKSKLIESRVNTTNAVTELISRLQNKPKKLFSASAIGYYGSNQYGELQDEQYIPEDKSQFTHQLCKKWEEQAKLAAEYNVKVVIMRIGVVLGRNGGALSKMLTPYKIGLGGKIGDGKQIMSWVHLQDVVNAMMFLMNLPEDSSDNDNEQQSSEIYNLTAPNPVSNEQFSKILSGVLGMPAFFNVPAFMIKAIFGEMGEELLLKGQKIIPTKLEKAGFEFRYPKLKEALEQIVL